MANTLDQYLDKIEGLAFFDPGRVLDQMISQLPPADRNDVQGWAAYATASMKQAWAALPADIRNLALDAVNKVLLQVVSGVLGEATQAVGQAVRDLTDSLGAIPIVGIIIEALELLIGGIVEGVKGIDEANAGASKYYYKDFQFRMVRDEVIVQRKLVRAVFEIDLYPHWYKSGLRINSVDWRAEPVLTPILGPEAKALWGIDVPAPTGYGGSDCMPGMPIGTKGGGLMSERREDWVRQGDGDFCDGKTVVSALYFPYWTPNLPAKPFAVYDTTIWGDTPFKIAPRNPNLPLITGQQAILADFRTNLRSRGAEVLGVLNTFRGWYEGKLDRGQGWWALPMTEDGLMVVPSGGGLPDRYAVDQTYNADHQHTMETRFFKRSDGLIASYGERGDLSRYGVVAPENLYSSVLGVSLAQHNTIVAQSKSFFTARRRFFENTAVMKQIVSENQLGTYDPDIREVIEAQANPPKFFLIDGVTFSPPTPKQGLTPTAAAILAAGAEAMTQGRSRQ